jgi:hypothetical protein
MQFKLEDMLLDAKQCNQRAQKQWGKSTMASVIQGKNTGGVGPRKSQRAGKSLSTQARMINKLLRSNLNVPAIVDLIELPEERVSSIIKRYELPRNAEGKVDAKFAAMG